VTSQPPDETGGTGRPAGQAGGYNPWGPPERPVNFTKPQAGEPYLDPNDPYRYGRPETNPNDPYRFGPPAYPPPQAPMGYPAPPPGYDRYPQPPTRNGMAIAALVLGILGIVLFFIPFVGMIPGILGIVFGAVALRAVKRGGAGRGMAIAGLVCGAIGTVICLIWTVYVFNRVADCAQYQGTPSQYELCIRND
jgi:hypothetical protein